jgi:homoserine kinase
MCTSINPKDNTTPSFLGGLTFAQKDNSAYQYHHTAKTHVECVVLIERAKGL